MEKVKVPLHKHPLIPFTRFDFSLCGGCELDSDYLNGGYRREDSYVDTNYIYGGYRCNESGCDIVYHKDCAIPLPEINYSSHPDHPLKLTILDWVQSRCNLCGKGFYVGYWCSICDFNLDLRCVKSQTPLLLPENSYLHEHPLKLILGQLGKPSLLGKCVCDDLIYSHKSHFRCYECEFFIHMECVDVSLEAYHTCHPQHLLKSFTCQVPHYADKKCLLCAMKFDQLTHQLHHCDVCNFSICRKCMKNPPPLIVESKTTHEHQLHLVPRVIKFTCNSCGTKGDRSPYFCLQCNFMIHRECIDLPRVININRHFHRISYTPRLGHGGECVVCHKEVDAFYGAYSCSKCSPSYVVHSKCATRKDVWDMIELEGTPEEEEIPPYVEIDEFTIKHISHDHNLLINKDEKNLHESIVCEACVFQISSEHFFECKQCNFIIHEKCAKLPLKKPHLCHNQRFILRKDSRQEFYTCDLCEQIFTGFRYESDDQDKILDVRCSSISDPLTHESHPHPLYYSTNATKCCSECGNEGNFSCDKCDFSLDYKCATLPQKVMRHRYDDHPLYLSYGEGNVEGEYWCEACETKVNPKKWFYTCNDCGVILHISCVMGDFTYIGTGSMGCSGEKMLEAVPNTSISRPVCSVCKCRCKHPTIIKVSNAQVVVCICSLDCFSSFFQVPQGFISKFASLVFPL